MQSGDTVEYPAWLLDTQVGIVAKSACCQLTEQEGLALVTHAVVTARLDYRNAPDVGLPLKAAWKL